MKIINLLPKEKQQELRYRKLFKVVVLLMAFSGVSFAFVLLAQFGVRFYLQQHKTRLQKNIGELQQFTNKEENAKIKQEIGRLNNFIADYETLSASVPKISKAVRAFAPLVPQGVLITSMRIDANRNFVDISGFSPTRELVIELYENILAENKNFPNIDYPLENVAKPTEINFHFTFNIDPELLK